MHNIGIIGAMEEEIALLQQKSNIISEQEIIGLTFYKGTLHNKNIVLVKSGIGKVNAALCTQILIDRFDVDCVINVGVAGAVYKQLSIGDIVISEDAVQHDMDTSVFGDPIGFPPFSVFLAIFHKNDVNAIANIFITTPLITWFALNLIHKSACIEA